MRPIPTVEPIRCACHGEPYRVRLEGKRLVARCPGGSAWGGEPRVRIRAPQRTAHPCEACGLEIPSAGRAGRPLRWHPECASPAVRARRSQRARRAARTAGAVA